MTKFYFSTKSKIFFTLLKKVRQKAGLNQEELAKKIKKPQSFISKYESGERRLDFLELREICIACGITIEEFSRMYDKLSNDS